MARKKLDDMTAEELEVLMGKTITVRQKIFEQIEPLEKKSTRLYNKISRLQERIDRLKTKKKFGWEWLLSDASTKSSFKYKLVMD